jgi:fatty acid desaturase
MSDMKKLDKILARYELPESKSQTITQGPADNATGLVFRDAFHEDVKQLARDHFKEAGVSHKMKTWVFVQTLLVILAEILCVAAILYNGSWVAMILLPIFGAWLTFNVAHDASHFALSHRPYLNSLFALTSEPMFFNSTAWYVEHVVQHHVYTNDEPDVDLYHFLPICRTTRLSRYMKIFKLQKILVWLALPTSVLHLSFVVPLDLLTRNIDAVTGTRRYEQCHNVDDLVAGCRKWLIAELTVSLGFSMIFFYAHGLFKGFAWLAISYSIASACFIGMTQGAHLQEECMVGKEFEDLSWAKRQVLTAINFEPQSFFWWQASGGLNVQGIHHVLPPISATHLRDMYPKFKILCEKHGVTVKEAPGWATFFGGFLAWIAELSREDESEQQDVSSKAKLS